MDKETRKIQNLLSNNIVVFGLVVLIVVGAYMLGSLRTKVAYLEQSKTLVANNGAQGAPEAVPTQQLEAPDVPKVTKDDHIRGNKNAPVMLVEYSDYECPFCKNFHGTATQIMDQYKDKVAWVYRHYPLSFHVNAQKEAEAAECAFDAGGEDAFWKYTDAIYERTTSNGTGFALDKLVPLAKEFGLDEAKFKQCLDSGKYEKKVKDQQEKGTAAGITGTPGNVLINVKTGKTRLIPGAVPFDQIKPEIDALLEG